ncbi:MAG: hypothetical protein IT359_08675 [Gemmatimonadaceae bacterium]|nr:hypothetical protein [Gemmatimonadaceae bacterium]
MIIADACMTDITNACHGTPLIYGGQLYGASVSYSSWPYDCPSGCTTYPLTYPQRSQINRAIALSKPSCAWASTILTDISGRQKFKSYNVDDTNAGDYHDDPFQPKFGEIHIYIEAFAGGTYNWSD